MTSLSTSSTDRSGSALGPPLRVAALSTAAISLVFAVNNYLIFWQGWPGLQALFAHLGWFYVAPPPTPLTPADVTLAWLQLMFYVLSIVAAIALTRLRTERTMTTDAADLAALAAYITRAAFWAVLLVGPVDMAISFLRVENLLVPVFGEHLATQIGRATYRGNFIHYPLIGVALVIAAFTRSLGFIWLSLLIVLAEFQIVLARFIFSYEQAFMGDLVRFWYAALFLFASAYTLIEEGHVRVDILYASFPERKKAWTNVLGSIFFGIPLCWIILTSGMWDKSNLINAPLLSYEVTQSGYGMYVKYLMAGFLLVYALSMMVQFLGYVLRNLAVLMGDPDARPLGPQNAP